MFRYLAAVAAVAVLATPAIAGVMSFPAGFLAQMMQTNGTSLSVRVGSQGPAVEKSSGTEEADYLRFVASNVTGGVVPNSGHWIIEENPRATIKLVTQFLAKSKRISLGHEARIHLVGSRVTLARDRFQAPSIQDFHLAAAVADQLALLQRTRRARDACATYSEHVSEEFLGKTKLIGMCPIASHEEPARKPRLDDMEAGTDGHLRELVHQDV